jgi:hypothetical protein
MGSRSTLALQRSAKSYRLTRTESLTAARRPGASELGWTVRYREVIVSSGAQYDAGGLLKDGIAEIIGRHEMVEVESLEKKTDAPPSLTVDPRPARRPWPPTRDSLSSHRRHPSRATVQRHPLPVSRSRPLAPHRVQPGRVRISMIAI